MSQVRVMWEEETSTGKMPQSDCPVGKSVEYFLVVMGGSSSLWVVPPWTVGSEFYKKQTEKDINSKPVRCTLP